MTATAVLDQESEQEAGEGNSGDEDTDARQRRRDTRRQRWGQRADDWRQPETVITLLVVAGCMVFTFFQLQPSQIFAQTTPAGGDMGAHVWLPAYVKDHLLPHLRITGWTPDQYAGFPALTYYFPLPIVGIALLSFLVPYDIAFKLVSVAGLLTLPLAAWAFGRLSRMPFPGPACLAVATVPFLFSREFTIYGGNIASTMAGEFSFSISLSLALVFLGLVARGLETGKGRALAAVLLAATAMSHILPTFFAVSGAVVLLAMRPDLRRLRWTAPVFVVGGGLAAFWAVPFAVRLPYATNMGYEKLHTYATSLFPGKDTWLFVLAGIGFVLAAVRRRRLGTFLGIMTVLAAVVFRLAPQARLWNARVLPFWFLCLYLLVGVALAEVGTVIVEGFSRDPLARRGSLIPVPVFGVLASLVWVGFPLHVLPGGHTSATTGKYSWLGISSHDQSYVPGWVHWNFSGYQSSAKARSKEYFALVNKMKTLGNTPSLGCGRAMWEYEPELDQMGTPDALMLLPYWTNGCIGSMEGLYYESSATTPYHFLNAAELSQHPSNPVRGLTYPSSPNVTEGVQHLQMLGVKYFMSISPEVQKQADADTDLQLVATVGPYPVSYTSAGTSTTQQRTWKIYQVAGSALVSPLVNQPVVMKGVAGGGDPWLKAAESWYLDQNRWDVQEAASGPSTWARVSASDSNPPRVPLAPVQVSAIKATDMSISFTVDQIGQPVLVKTSYFPNWKVSGAKGVYRVAPNLMVVIPTSRHVNLHYGYTPIDWLGFILTLLAIAGVVVLWRLPPVAYPEPRHLSRSPSDDGTDAELARHLGEPYHRLEHELSDVYPGGLRGNNGDLDVWVGQPGGLDLARYYATGWSPTGREQLTGSVSAVGSATADGQPPAAGQSPVATQPPTLPPLAE